MDGCMEAWMDGHMDGWMHTWINIFMSGKVDRWILPLTDPPWSYISPSYCPTILFPLESNISKLRLLYRPTSRSACTSLWSLDWKPIFPSVSLRLPRRGGKCVPGSVLQEPDRVPHHLSTEECSPTQGEPRISGPPVPAAPSLLGSFSSQGLLEALPAQGDALEVL